MVKAKDFWDYLCNVLDYRFFAGIPCLGFKPLYDSMNSKIMHYVPAVNINVALGLASGMYVSGIKSGILLHINELYNLLGDYYNFNKLYEIPVLFIVYCNDENLSVLSSNKISYITLTDEFKPKLKNIVNKLEKGLVPHALIVKEGIIG